MRDSRSLAAGLLNRMHASTRLAVAVSWITVTVAPPGATRWM